MPRNTSMSLRVERMLGFANADGIDATDMAGDIPQQTADKAGYAALHCGRRLICIVGSRLKCHPSARLGITLTRNFAGVHGVPVRLMGDAELSRFEVLRALDRRRLRIAASAHRGSIDAVRLP